VIEARRRACTLALTLCCARPSSGAAAPGELRLQADAAGHFLARGLVNGQAVEFLVDTGASAVTLGQAQAEALGLAWRDAPRAQARTAAGSVEARLLELDELRVGPLIARRVGAAVVPGPLLPALLGNTFLERYAWRRDGPVLRLRVR
jgi:aspartyl protease family protein